MYTRIIETYLTVCTPELNVSVRQNGWSGHKAIDFIRRMTNDCLIFKPTIATTCFGMNDHLYGPYTREIGDAYRSNSMVIIEAFKSQGARVVQGSPGCVGKVPGWTHSSSNTTVLDLNLNLCELRNIGIEVSKKEKVSFADVFWPMLVKGYFAGEKHAPDFALPGKDGVHPDWAGQLVMAYSFLRSFGLDGEIGTFTVDLRSKRATVSSGHEKMSFSNGELTLRSHRYPFCIGNGDVSRSDNMRAGAALVPFDNELNRLILQLKHTQAARYKITWGGVSKSFAAEKLSAGINLAIEFPVNPFTEAFERVEQAVLTKQKFETLEIQSLLRSPEARADIKAAAVKAEQERNISVTAIKKSFQPVTHTLRIEPE